MKNRRFDKWFFVYAHLRFLVLEIEFINFVVAKPNVLVPYLPPPLRHPNHIPYLFCFTSLQVPRKLLSRLQSECLGGMESNNGLAAGWPIWGGGDNGLTNDDDDATLLVAGHADGRVTLLLPGPGDTMRRLGTINTATLFNLTDEQVGTALM